MTRLGAEAREWALGQVKQRTSPYGTWYRYCLAFVRIAFGRPGGTPDAGQAWDVAKHKHRTSDPQDIPADAPVFWELPSVADHVAYSLGDGWCLSNDILRSGEIDRVRIQTITSRWGAQLLGWTEDLNGDIVWTLPAPPESPFLTRTVFHYSGEFSDKPRQQQLDIEKVFRRGLDHLTGTEAGEKVTQSLLRAAAKKYGYRIHISRTCWVAVRKELIHGGWKTGFVSVLKPNEGKTPHRERGIAWASYDNRDVGRTTQGVGHLLIKGRKPGDPNFECNQRFTRAIAKFGREFGKGAALCFYNGDQNDDDEKNDTFRGGPFTSLQDELDQHERTGRSAQIDVAASYNGDGRVEAQAVRALDDSELFLHTNHNPVEGEYRIRKLKKEPR